MSVTLTEVVASNISACRTLRSATNVVAVVP